MIKTSTRFTKIEVSPNYVPSRSDLSKPIFFFSYHIKITNISNDTIQLHSRYWNITDGNGNVEEIRGPGVVGRQPHIKSGETFEYTSYCPLPTNFGVMHGYFEMINNNGTIFNAKISPFRLTTPFSVN
ncbi:MAG: Co2+/Mg2+ efflux protein ApaG [Candidatus Neomarinimicrobiota bacterium]|jgi:ApaG protein|nr:Co2+/Mg2+ efflux protein ApaG [Candidatus Neomarinimicrobiota bacterium]|tara:strand:+ start:116 stop:499 length:384 start_codon:yes stop_codon:yes gene_type:complete